MLLGLGAAWLIMFIYVVLITLRERKLRKELDRVRRMVEVVSQSFFATLGHMKAPAVFFLFALCAAAEVRTLTLRDALDIALKQNPDVVLARLDQQRARAQVTIVKDAFVPKLFAGSGAAYTNGFPMSIDGNAPALVQAKTQMAIFDRPQSYRAAQANEAARGAEIDIGLRQDEVAYRVASLFFDADQTARSRAAVVRGRQRVWCA